METQHKGIHKYTHLTASRRLTVLTKKRAHTQDDCMDVVSGCRHPKYNHSFAWPVFEQLSPGLCETSARPPETALSTCSPGWGEKKKIKSNAQSTD